MRAGGGIVVVAMRTQERGRDRFGEVTDNGMDGAVGGEVDKERVRVGDAGEDDSGRGQVGDDILWGRATTRARCIGGGQGAKGMGCGRGSGAAEDTRSGPQQRRWAFGTV